jgi:hypothetical protein
MKIRLLIPVLVLMVLLVSACAAPPQLINDQFLQDTSLVDGEPCASPCWRGITPGETAWGDALNIIEDDRTLTDLRVEDSQETDEIAATFQQSGGIPCCLIYSEDGVTVDQLLLQVAPTMTLGEVLDTHGDPEFLTPTVVSDDQASAALYYPEQSMVVYAFAAGAATGQIDADSPIFAVLYVRPADMENIVNNSVLFNWTGFDSYGDYAARTPDRTPEPTPEGEAEGE